MEAVSNSSDIQDQFLTLLVTQLRNQDPLEPTKQEDFLAQLAQFSTLEGIETLNVNIESFLESQAESQAIQNELLLGLQQTGDISSAANLVGMEVQYDQSNGEGPSSGIVQSVVLESDGVSLRIGDDLVPVSEIRQVGNFNE